MKQYYNKLLSSLHDCKCAIQRLYNRDIPYEDFTSLSHLTLRFTVVLSALPVIMLYIIASLSASIENLPPYVYVATILCIISIVVALISHSQRDFKLWSWFMIISYTIIPFIAHSNSYMLNSTPMFMFAAILITILNSWVTSLVYTVTAFGGLLAYSIWKILGGGSGIVFSVRTFEHIPSMDDAVYVIETPINYSLALYGSYMVAWAITPFITWVIDFLITSSLNRRQETIVAYNQLEEKKQHQDHMFAIIGHELRTPVAASYMTITELLESEDDKPQLSDKCYSTVIAVYKELQHTLSLLDDMKIVSNNDAIREYTRQPDYPSKTVKRAINTLREEASSINMSIDYQYDKIAGKRYMFSNKALTQITLNMVKNAIRHSNADKLVINLAGVDLGNGRASLILEFIDNGVGIPSDLYDKIFDAFYSRDRSNDTNTGLGLYICKEIVETLDGSIMVDSVEGVGTTFTVVMELDEQKLDIAQPRSSRRNRYTDKKYSGLNVLVVEDNSTIRDLTMKILVGQGATVDTAEDGREGIKLFFRNKYDIIFTDYFMPEMDGRKMIEYIRMYNTDIPIIAISAATVGPEFEELKSAGANYVIPKPATIESLREIRDKI
jgi:signal transduction histidine kinase